MIKKNDLLIQGIFKHMIDGDDALLKMTAAYYKRLGIGAEIYPYPAESIQDLRRMIPADSCCTAHLAHALIFTEKDSQDQLVEYGRHGSGLLRGMVVHDNRSLADDQALAIKSTEQLSKRLDEVDSPLLFIEYACGVDTADFLDFLNQIKGLPRIGTCIDISHVAIAVCRREYKRLCGEELFSVKIDSPQLQEKMPYIQQSVEAARRQTILFAAEAASIGLPTHFHLHDGHPLSWFSPFGVRDHLPFFWQIPLPFEYEGRAMVDGIFQFSGLRELLRQVIHSGVPRPISLMLEIHPQKGYLPLGEYEELFVHWQDKRNAEQHRYWLDLIGGCASILRQAIEDATGEAGSV